MPKKSRRGQRSVPEQFLDEDEVREALAKCIYNNESHQQHLRFVNPYELKQFWDANDVRRIAKFSNYSPEVFETIESRFLLVLAIAIWSEWNDLIRFLPVFVAENRDDKSLPFSKDQLVDMDTGIENFISQQYMFMTEIIRVKDEPYIQRIDASARLPFLGDGEPIDSGGYGLVTRGQIAPHCLKYEEFNSTNAEVGKSDLC